MLLLLLKEDTNMPWKIVREINGKLQPLSSTFENKQDIEWIFDFLSGRSMPGHSGVVTYFSGEPSTYHLVECDASGKVLEVTLPDPALPHGGVE